MLLLYKNKELFTNQVKKKQFFLFIFFKCRLTDGKKVIKLAE